MNIIWLLLFGSFYPVFSVKLPDIPELKNYKPLLLYGVKVFAPKVHFQLIFTYDNQHVNRLELYPATKDPSVRLPTGWQEFTGQITITNSMLVKHPLVAQGRFDDLNQFTGIVEFGRSTWYFSPMPAKLKQQQCCLSHNTIFYTYEEMEEFGVSYGDDMRNIGSESGEHRVNSESRGLHIIKSNEETTTKIDPDANYKKRTCKVKFFIDQYAYDELKGYSKEEKEFTFRNMMEQGIISLNSLFWPKNFGRVSQFSFKLDAIEYLETTPQWLERSQNSYEEGTNFLDAWKDQQPTNIGKLGEATSCANFIITYRKFLRAHGRAFVQGICHRTDSKGFINLAVYQKWTTQGQFDYTLRHEMSHLLGAEHDQGTVCGLWSDGPFLMNRYAFFDSDLAKNRLSECSQEAITAKLEGILSKPKEDKENCFD